MGTVRRPLTLALRTATLVGYSALLAAGVTVYVDVILGALTGHTWQLFGALWLYAMAVGGAVTGVAAAFGSVASMALTAFLVVIGNAAAAGPVGRPLLSGFYSTFTAIVPQGSRRLAAAQRLVLRRSRRADATCDAGDLGRGGVFARNRRHRFASELSCAL